MSPVPGRIALANEETVEAVARAVPARFYALVLLLRFTGLRWEEAVALRRRRCFVATMATTVTAATSAPHHPVLAVETRP